MNFLPDDPLAELLSDNSLDNDNSFYEATLGHKRNTKPTAVARTSRKLDDLFGIQEEDGESKNSQKLNDNWKPLATSTTRAAMHDDDVDLGFDPKKPKALGKTNILDDLLASPTTTTRRPTTAPKTAAISRQSTETTNTTNDTTTLPTRPAMRPKTAAGRRGSNNSGTLLNTDPLGLFGKANNVPSERTDAQQQASGMSTPTPTPLQPKPRRGTTADWLGLDNATTAVADAMPTKHSEANKAVTEQAQLLEQSETVERQQTPAESSSTPAQNMLLLNTMVLDTQSTLTALQQQETQLDVTTRVLRQERTLLEMQRKQEELLKQQEHKFNVLLQQQMQRQQQIEQHICAQQQRIQAHIQLLMTGNATAAMLPAAIPTANAADDEAAHVTRAKDGAVAAADSTLELPKLEAELERMRLDKLQLEQLLERSRTKFEHELEMNESSYRKQLQMLEEQLQAVEARLKGEIEQLQAFYNSKITALTKEHEALQSKYEAQTADLQQRHADELQRERKLQEEHLELLREEHRRALERLRECKLLEFANMQDSHSYLETLRSASTTLTSANDTLDALREELQRKISENNKAKEQQLQTRETRLEAAEKLLKQREQHAAEEQSRLMQLVTALELQLQQQTKKMDEENWLQRQQMASLEAQQSAFELEKQQARAQMERDEQRIEQLKQQQLAEFQRQSADLQEQRAKLAVERTQLETERRLQSQNDGEQQRLQQEAAIEVAQEAVRKADAERARYTRLLRELELQRRDAQQKTQTLQDKEAELERQQQQLHIAEQKAREATKQAQELEQNCQAKIRLLQRRAQELGEQQYQNSEEQLWLTRERIRLMKLRKQLEERNCVMCKMQEQNAAVTKEVFANDAPQEALELSGPQGALDDNIVDLLLDRNIDDSYRQMRRTLAAAPGNWMAGTMLDDDAKEKALKKLEFELDAMKRDAV